MKALGTDPVNDQGLSETLQTDGLAVPSVSTPSRQAEHVVHPPVDSFPPLGHLRTLGRDLLDALRGSERDYTTGPIGQALLLLAIPMVLEMSMESVFAVVDVYFVASLGASAVATVGLTESLLTLMYAVGMGLAMGTTALVARRIGEKDPKAAASSAVQAVMVALMVSVPFMLTGLFFSKDLLALMGGDAWTIEHGYRYTTWMLGGSAVIMFLFVLNAVFRGAGDAATAMRVLWISNGINIFLDPALIFGWGPLPEMGITGAAVATTIGRGIGVTYQIWALLRGAKHIRVLPSQIRLQARVMVRLVRTSIGGIAQFLIATASWIVLVRIVAVFGSEVLAGYTIGVRIFLFTLLPAWGLAGAAATLVGQNLGAGCPERAERSTWIAGRVTMVFLGVVSVVYLLNDTALVRLFTSEPRVITAGADCLRILTYGYVIYAWGMVITQAFNGAGDTFTPTKINVVCFWLFEIPLAYVLALPLGFEERGVYAAILTAETAAALLALVLFRRGTWKETKV